MLKFRSKRLANNKNILNSYQDPETKVAYTRDLMHIKRKDFYDAYIDFVKHMKEQEPVLYDSLKKKGFFEHLHPDAFDPENLTIPEYPGSLKGLAPEDDPEYFIQW